MVERNTRVLRWKETHVYYDKLRAYCRYTTWVKWGTIDTNTEKTNCCMARHRGVLVQRISFLLFYSQRWLTPNKYRHHEFNVCLRHVQHCRITEEPLRFVKTHSYYSKHVMPNMTTCSRWQPKKNTKHVHTSAHNPSLKLIILPSSLGLPGPREASPSEADLRSRRPSAGCSGAGSAGGDAHRSGVAHRDTTPVEQVAVALPNRTSWGGGGGVIRYMKLSTDKWIP